MPFRPLCLGQYGCPSFGFHFHGREMSFSGFVPFDLKWVPQAARGKVLFSYPLSHPVFRLQRLIRLRRKQLLTCTGPGGF